MSSIPPPSRAIVADRLVMHFGDVHALQGVSFDVPTGSVLGLLGPNGAGKTTAVRILTTMLEAHGGTGVGGGRRRGRAPQRVRRRIGLAGQYAAVDENLTGRENLTSSAGSTTSRRRTPSTRAVELLEQFHLTDAGEPAVRTYSGGMRRRLDLGRGARSPIPRCCFSTSPPPVSTRRAGRTCGT
jgi:ABC-2 type transport system ATP-binding protein